MNVTKTPLSKLAYYKGAASALYKLGVDADSFVEAVEEEEEDTASEDAEGENRTTSEADEPKPPRWSNSSSLESGDVATRNHEMGLPSFGGV